MAQTPEQKAKAKAAGAATREASAARKAEIAANPIDWAKQCRSITEWYAKRQSEGWK